MKDFTHKVQAAYGFSDYEMRLIRYSLTALFYDSSKLLIFGIYYYCTGDFAPFLFASVPLMLLRTKNGGIHFKKYWSCFLFTFAYLELSIHILPKFLPIPSAAVLGILFLCAVCDWHIGPISLTRKTTMSDEYIQKAKLQTLLLILLLAALLLFFPANRYFIISFWTVTLHTIQMIITKKMKGGTVK